MYKYIVFFILVFTSCEEPKTTLQKQFLWSIDLPTINYMFLPTFNKDTLYFYFSAEIYAVNINKGSVIWKQTIEDLKAVGYICSDSANLWLQTDSKEQGSLYKLQSNNGNVLSKYSIPAYCVNKTYQNTDSTLLLRSSVPMASYEFNMNTGNIQNINDFYYIDLVTIPFNDSLLISWKGTAPIIFNNKKYSTNLNYQVLPRLIAAPEIDFDLDNQKYIIYDSVLKTIKDTVDFFVYANNKIYVVKNNSIFSANLKNPTFEKIYNFSEIIVNIATYNKNIYLINDNNKVFILNTDTNEIRTKILASEIQSKNLMGKKTFYIHNNKIFYYSSSKYAQKSLNCESMQ